MLGGAVGEQPDRLRGADRVQVVVIGGRVHGGDPVDALAADAERLPARREQRGLRAVAQQRIRELGAGVEDVLAVVQQQEQAALADRLHHRVHDGQARVLGYAQHGGDGDGGQVRVLQRGKIREPDPVARPVQELGRHLKPEAGLARPARAGERDQAGGGDQAAHLGELTVAADEARHLRREVVEQLRVVERPEGRESQGETVGLELENPLGQAEVLEPVQAKVPQGGARWHRVAEQRRRRGREHDLAPVSGGRDAGAPVDVEADQAGRCLGRLAGMDAHPDADRLTVGPWVRPERPLHLDGRGHARAGRGEHREERVALGIDLPAAVRGQPGTDQPVVRGEDLRVGIAQALQQRRRALDVGEEKSERQRGQRPEAFI